VHSLVSRSTVCTGSYNFPFFVTQCMSDRNRLSPAEVDELKEAFQVFDKDDSGSINRK
jgi:Ca2+-binding EF-hand superfamily protein